MKTLFNILTVLCLIATSCTIVYFDQPQPVGKKNMNAFPKNILGSYKTISEEDTILRIEKNYILAYFDEGKNLKFSMSDNLIARRYKGDYYINILDKESSYWNVYRLSFKKGLIYLGNPISGDEEIERFTKITKIEKIDSGSPDSKDYRLNPSQPDPSVIFTAILS